MKDQDNDVIRCKWSLNITWDTTIDPKLCTVSDEM